VDLYPDVVCLKGISSFMHSVASEVAGLDHHLILPYRVSLTTEKLTLPEHLISPLGFIEVDVVLSFVSPYFM